MSELQIIGVFTIITGIALAIHNNEIRKLHKKFEQLVTIYSEDRQSLMDHIAHKASHERPDAIISPKGRL